MSSPSRCRSRTRALLLTGTGVQFLLVLIGFLDVPLAGLGWEIGAYLALAAAALAAAPGGRGCRPPLPAAVTEMPPAG